MALFDTVWYKMMLNSTIQYYDIKAKIPFVTNAVKAIRHSHALCNKKIIHLYNITVTHAHCIFYKLLPWFIDSRKVTTKFNN